MFLFANILSEVRISDHNMVFLFPYRNVPERRL